MKKTIILLVIIYSIILVFTWLNSFVMGLTLLGFAISILFISPAWLYFFFNTTIDFITKKFFLKLSLLWLYCTILTGLFVFVEIKCMEEYPLILKPEGYSGNWSIEESKKDSLFICEYEHINYGSVFLRDSAKINIIEAFIERRSLSDDTTIYTIIQIDKGFKGYNRKWKFADYKTGHLGIREKRDKNGKRLGQYKIFKYYEQLPPDTIKFYIAEWIPADSLPGAEKVLGNIIDSIVIAPKEKIK